MNVYMQTLPADFEELIGRSYEQDNINQSRRHCNDCLRDYRALSVAM
jgi:hypothetical protein